MTSGHQLYTRAAFGKTRLHILADNLLVSLRRASPRVSRGHRGAVHWIAINFDGRWVVTGSADKTVLL
jgi:hypothetical protein